MWELMNYLFDNYYIKMFVIVCNIVIVIVLEDIQCSVGIFVVGVIQLGVRVVIKVMENQYIGVIGIENMIKSNVYEEVFLVLNFDLKVENLVCFLFVFFVESGKFFDKIVDEIVKILLYLLKDILIDMLILGCIYYFILKEFIQRYMGEYVNIILFGDEIVREVSMIFLYKGLLNQFLIVLDYQFLIIGVCDQFVKIVDDWFGYEVGYVECILL